jgi:hypothetical protein
LGRLGVSDLITPPATLLESIMPSNGSKRRATSLGIIAIPS